ncbi:MULTISPECIES: nucleotide exchange factor GrpE [unclassified Microbacterium]|uniref:nucleotide exchange factor GrpE n=1 Tax=unclassified Microbacterium TaxID=2609290 RepID=UPI000CFB9F0F|nr:MULTISPECIES: nucleotide exchange factor GrpE [unclassified Microbacterium]PQZ60045.1 nucleotide exchange factor GrpE [Microbacterium sp. MYb43]PQZ79607.1 nucleotide exchange factor GrpE [Microbacterium sp. MYb40]PRB23088.1 nucleotide exchange factor GrpE [Microbacterium sp. MYb54]PRB27633.1 nucleotide exchange factor GrpE [Microbacterium sp. MYb50]PRB65923.1 nucleotide exchange factor GrpE [Microbacterium sp. MYb24]
MTDKNFDDNAGVPEEGSDANASGPQPDFGNPDSTEAAASEGSDDDLTVDDILGATQTGEAAAEDAVLADLESTLLNDLKRLQAEYANYRRRTEEQRQVEIERARGEAAKGLIPVLDDLDRAAQHGDLVEGTPFAVIADKVRVAVERLGVVAYGEKGEDFDPQRHEAIFQQPAPGAEKTTILEVVEVGYRLGDVELRPAKVVVAVPEG